MTRLPHVAALLGVIAAGCGEAKKVTLRYHPPQGSTFPYLMEQSNSVRFESGQMAKVPEQKIQMHIYFTQTITGPTDGGTGVTMRFDSVTMDGPMMGPGFQAALDSLRGRSASVVFDDRRNVVKAAGAPGGEPSPVLAKGLRGLSFPFPDGPVGVGDSWSAEIDLPLGQVAGANTPFRAKTKFTIRELATSTPDTTILVALETTLPTEPIVMTQQGQAVTMKLAGTLTGDQLYSVSRGAAIHSKLGGTIGIDVSGGSLGAKGMHMTMTQATSLNLSGVP
ncbi:MAG TPA: hypothetical protein VLV16_12155 [Gemmatimonadales bacterium]|nr:hypothetical protein [Gemmatimonadales bacterium]